MLDTGTVSIIVTIAIALLGYVAIFFTMKSDVANLSDDVKRLEVKQDKYNNLQERMTKTESKAKTAHRRIDETNVDIKEIKDDIKEIKKMFMEFILGENKR